MRSPAVFMIIVALTLTGAPVSMEAQSENREKIQVLGFPELKLGVISQNFIRVLPVSVANAKYLIDYAAEEGFEWMELRDSDAELSRSECQQIAAYARSKGVELSYSNQRALLDRDFWDVFRKGLMNAGEFSGPRTIRVLASGAEFEDPGKIGYTADELSTMVETANRAADLAQEMGLQLVVENWREPLSGNPPDYFGLKDFFDRVDRRVGWEFDTANFFSASRVRSTEETVRSFLLDHVHRIGYTHLKASVGGSPQPVLGDNPLDFGFIFSVLSKHGKSHIALELVPVESRDDVFGNHDRSLQYLVERGLIVRP